MKSQNLIHILMAIVCLALSPQMQAIDPPHTPDPGAIAGSNTADGWTALGVLTTGIHNSAFGWFSLSANTEGNYNTGLGSGTLLANTGDQNTAVGTGTLSTNTTGTSNTAAGAFALFSSIDGSFNTAVGYSALGSLTDGSLNVSVGWRAGDNYTGAETNNICIGQGTLGFAGESNSIRIGQNSDSHGIKVIQIAGQLGPNSIEIGDGWINSGGITVRNALIGNNIISIGALLPAPTTTVIGGILNTVPPPGGTHPVVIGAFNGQLADGSLSSRRFKKDIAPIDKISEGILALKPVTFHFKNDDSNYPQFGLIAEEVAEVNPDWMTRDPQGEIYGVRYDTIPILLLNEFLKAHRRMEEQDKRIEELTAQLKQQATQIQKVSAQLEASKPASRVVNNP